MQLERTNTKYKIYCIVIVQVDHKKLQGVTKTGLAQRFPQDFVFKSPWVFHGLFGGPTDRVGDSFNFFVRPSSKLCVSDAHSRVREKHACVILHL